MAEKPISYSVFLYFEGSFFSLLEPGTKRSRWCFVEPVEAQNTLDILTMQLDSEDKMILAAFNKSLG